MLILYNSLIWSTLEYGTPFWNSRYPVGIDRIECVQCAFTRFLAYIYKGKTGIEQPATRFRFALLLLKAILKGMGPQKQWIANDEIPK